MKGQRVIRICFGSLTASISKPLPSRWGSQVVDKMGEGGREGEGVATRKMAPRVLRDASHAESNEERDLRGEDMPSLWGFKRILPGEPIIALFSAN